MREYRRLLGFATAPAVVIALTLSVAACGGPPLDSEDAARQIAARLPGAAVDVVGMSDVDAGRIVAIEASGEPMRFAFRLVDEHWQLDRFQSEDGALVDLETATDAWGELLKAPREITLAELAADGRPAAPIEILVTGLRITAIAPDRIELVDASGAEAIPAHIEGSNLDRLPLEVGREVSIQVGGLERRDNAWQPVRPETPAEILPLLEQMDVMMLQMLKIRHATGAVPIPYGAP